MKTKNKTSFPAIFICVMVCLCKPASAQFSLGARAGANLVTEPTTDYYHVFLALPYGGIFAQYKLPIPLDFQLGVNYSGEGDNLKDLSTGDTYDVRQSYLAVPLFVQYRFAFGGYVELGPQLGFLLSANEKDSGQASVDTKQYYKSTEISGGIGFGYEFNHTAPRGFGVNIRYLRSLSNIDNDPTDGADVKNRVLSIGLTYRLAK